MRRVRCWAFFQLLCLTACEGVISSGSPSDDDGTRPDSLARADGMSEDSELGGAAGATGAGDGTARSGDAMRPNLPSIGTDPALDLVAEEAKARFSCEDSSLSGQAHAVMRRLTRDELLHSMEAIVGSKVMNDAAVRQSSTIIPEESPGDLVREFQNGHALEHAHGMLVTAQAVAAAVAGDQTARAEVLGGCAADADVACAAAFLETTATRILKRPLNSDRKANMLRAFEAAGGGLEGLEGLLARLLQAPEAVFHLEPKPQQTQNCDEGSSEPMALDWNDDSAFFHPDGSEAGAPQRQLNESGWFVWDVPGSRIDRGFKRLVIDVVATTSDDSPIQIDLNLDDASELSDYNVPGGQHDIVVDIALEPGDGIKIGLRPIDLAADRTIEIRSVVMVPEAGAVECIVAPAAIQNGKVAVDDWSVAARVAYALTGQGPDTELLDAASRGELGSVDQVWPHAERLLETPEARRQLEVVFDSWLGLRAIPTPNETIANQAGMPADGLGAEARRELLDYVTYVVFDHEVGAGAMMSARVGFPRSDRMAQLYGTSIASGSDPVELQPGYGGLLLRVGPLLSGQYRSSPILRGVYVRKRVLCDELPSPDFSIVAERTEAVEAADPGLLTTREIMADITSPPTCMGCHVMINSIGFSLEKFGPLGELRELEVAFNSDGVEVAQHPIDTMVEMPNIEEGGPTSLDGSDDLNRALARSGKVRACIAERLYAQAFLRPIGDADMCVLSEVEQALREGGSVKEAWLRTVVNTDLFWSKAEVAQ